MRRGRPPYPDVLTPREQEVLALIREGLTNEQIGARLGVSEHGAKYHVAEILSKLGVSSRQEAARWSRPQRVAPGLLGLLTRHVAVGALVVAGLGLMVLAAGVILMHERNGGATQGDGEQQHKEDETLPPPPGFDDGPIRRMAYVEVQGDEADIWTMNPDGSGKVQLTNDPGSEGSPVWSPDGRQIAFTKSAGTSSDGPVALWVMNSDGSAQREILGNSGQAFAVWSPDGKQLAFSSSLLGAPNVFVVNLDGSNFRTLTNDTRVNAGQAWTQDGQRILFSNGAGVNVINVDGTNARVFYPLNRDAGQSVELSPDLSFAIARTEVVPRTGVYDVDLVDLGNGNRTSLMKSVDGVGAFQFSPDGKLIAYSQDDVMTSWSLSVINPDGTGARTIVTFPRQSDPAVRYSGIGWSGNGKYLLYVRSESVARFVSEDQFCYVSIDGTEQGCFVPRFSNNQDGASSPSLLLN